MKKHIMIYLLFSAFGMSIGFKSRALTITVPIRIKPLISDPMNLNIIDEWEISALYHERLIDLGGDEDTLRPSLASTWRYYPKTKEFEITLKPGMKFSDGSPLSMKEVAFSLNRSLVLDQENRLELSRCLKDSDAAARLDKIHPSIVLKSNLELVLLLDSCGPAIAAALSHANYAIISQHSIDQSGELKNEISVFSGAFSPRVETSRLILAPNFNNWRWRNKKPDSKVILVSDPEMRMLSDYDFFRTLKVHPSTKLSKTFRYKKPSTPIISWFLTAKKHSDSENIVRSKVILSDINANLVRKSLKYFDGSGSGEPSNSFFPPEFGCDSLYTPKNSSYKADRDAYHINIHESSSGASKMFSKQLVKAVEKLGFSTKSGSSKASSKHKKKVVDLQIMGQHLGADLHHIFELLFNQFKAIPDPEGTINTIFKKHEKLEALTSMAFRKEICKKFLHYNHAPLGVSRYLFYAREKRFLDLFSLYSGNILFGNIPQVLTSDQ